MKKLLLLFFAASLIVSPALADDKTKASKAKFVIPEFKAVDIDGNDFDLAKLKGKVVLVDFWATWCIPCLKEIPKLRKMHKALHEKGFVIVGVANNSKDDLTSFFESNKKVPWTSVADEKNVVSKDFKVAKWPTTVLIDRKGKLLGVDLSPVEMLNKIVTELDLESDPSKTLSAALKELKAEAVAHEKAAHEKDAH